MRHTAGLGISVVLALAAPAFAATGNVFEEHTVRYTGGPYEGAPFRYRLLKPATIEPGRRYPLVLFLHGAGERGTDNRKQLKYLPDLMARPAMRAKYPCFLLAPQCPAGKQWVDAPWSAKLSTPMAGQPAHPLQVAILALQAAMKSLPVAPDRVYLTGLSMGGYGAWELAMRHPGWFACVAPVCGGGDERQVARLVGLPVWAFHGDRDGVVPVVRSRTLVDALRKAGGKVKYTEYEGAGHGVWNRAYSDPEGAIPWMFAHTRRESSVSK